MPKRAKGHPWGLRRVFHYGEQLKAWGRKKLTDDRTRVKEPKKEAMKPKSRGKKP